MRAHRNRRARWPICLAAEGGAPGVPLGEHGERLRAWALRPGADRAPKPASSAGALICGRRTYDTSLPEWGAGGPHPPTPVVVITHAAPDDPPARGVYSFVTTGIEAALHKAREAAGERDVRIMGGAAIGQQFLAAAVRQVARQLTFAAPDVEHRGRTLGDEAAGDPRMHIGRESMASLDRPCRAKALRSSVVVARDGLRRALRHGDTPSGVRCSDGSRK
jgi:dihydrofolate reductase